MSASMSASTSGVLGTPHYLAPEVFRGGEDIDVCAGDSAGGSAGDSTGASTSATQRLLEQLKLVDAYAAGVVLHETCALGKPFDGPTLQVLLEAIVAGTPTRPIPPYTALTIHCRYAHPPHPPPLLIRGR
jgi:serine/threonine protein kinase